jgi:acetyl esterase/lipase
MPIAFAIAVVLAAVSLSAQNGASKILSVDHKVAVKSIVPAIAGEPAQIYVRERVADGLKNTAADRVVLFVHGAGTPAEVAFDVPTGDYSWMAFLAKNGFDVFSMDTEGYGRSSRPAPMTIRATCPTSSRSNSCRS